MVCKDCKILVLSAKMSRSTLKKKRKKNQPKPAENTFQITTYGVSSEHVIPGTSEDMCYPSMMPGERNHTGVEVSQSVALNILVNDIKVSTAKRNKGVSTEAKRALLAATGLGKISQSQVKKASAMIKVTPRAHIEGYNKITAYFEEAKKLNPKLKYDIEPKVSGVFTRLMVVLPHTKSFLPNMLNVFGIDAGFMPEVAVKGKAEPKLCCNLSYFKLKIDIIFCRLVKCRATGSNGRS